MDELWGLSAHPSQNQFVTTGYDKNLYFWDSLTHTAVWQKDLPVSIEVWTKYGIITTCITDACQIFYLVYNLYYCIYEYLYIATFMSVMDDEAILLDF